MIKKKMQVWSAMHKALECIYPDLKQAFKSFTTPVRRWRSQGGGGGDWTPHDFVI